MAQKILVVDDDRSICEILEFNLHSEGFDVITTHSAEEALECLDSSYDLLLLDVMMGGMSGYKMAEYLRQQGDKRPIIFLTAKDTENDMLTGFSVGGDDYISKPFSLKEVVARIKAVLKRSTGEHNQATDQVFSCGSLHINLETKEISIASKPIDLTKTETELLLFLIEHRGRILSRDEILAKVWSATPYITERTVDVHIARLRKKLGDYSSAIVNKAGYGYRFNSDLLCD